MRRNPSVASFPTPVTLVVVGDPDTANIITLSWVGVVCTSPPMLGVAIRPERHSYTLLRSRREFVVCVATKATMLATDICGVVSGRDCDKFTASGLTKTMRDNVLGTPRIQECPVAFECVCEQEMSLGSHTLFIGRVAGRHIQDDFVSKDHVIDHARLDPLFCVHGEYWNAGAPIAKAKHLAFEYLARPKHLTAK